MSAEGRGAWGSPSAPPASSSSHRPAAPSLAARRILRARRTFPWGLLLQSNCGEAAAAEGDDSAGEPCSGMGGRAVGSAGPPLRDA